MTYQVQASIPYFSGLPEDVVTNTFYFNSGHFPAPTALDYTNLLAVITAFYDAVYGGGTLMSLAPWMRAANASGKIYDLDDPTPRAPVFTGSMLFTPNVPATDSTPPEVALVVSFQGAKISGQPQARRRGRIYLGGIAAATTAGTTTTYPTPTTTIMAGVGGLIVNMAVAALAADWEWVVWSRTDQAAVPITDGWVDNAYDTQRRRGQRATVRDPWNI